MSTTNVYVITAWTNAISNDPHITKGDYCILSPCKQEEAARLLLILSSLLSVFSWPLAYAVFFILPSNVGLMDPQHTHILHYSLGLNASFAMNSLCYQHTRTMNSPFHVKEWRYWLCHSDAAHFLAYTTS